MMNLIDMPVSDIVITVLLSVFQAGWSDPLLLVPESHGCHYLILAGEEKEDIGSTCHICMALCCDWNDSIFRYCYLPDIGPVPLLEDTGQCLFFPWQLIWVRLYMHGKWQKGWILQMQEHSFGKHLPSSLPFLLKRARVKILASTNVLLYCLFHFKTTFFSLLWENVEPTSKMLGLGLLVRFGASIDLLKLD